VTVKMLPIATTSNGFACNQDATLNVVEKIQTIWRITFPTQKEKLFWIQVWLIFVTFSWMIFFSKTKLWNRLQHAFHANLQPTHYKSISLTSFFMSTPNISWKSLPIKTLDLNLMDMEKIKNKKN